MRKLGRIAFIGNHPPRKCGIATFTESLRDAIAAQVPDVTLHTVAMTEAAGRYDYPPEVSFEVHADLIQNYARAAEFLDDADVDVVSLQHEYGIFGGDAGGNILLLLSRLKVPVVTTLHTVLAEPSPMQRAVMESVIGQSASVVVMSRKARQLLRSVYGVPAAKIEVIPHGVPDRPFIDSAVAKARFGLEDRSVILTFGLLSPNKGIETMIDALPAIVERCPKAVYVVLGATHPNIVREQGETYRDGLLMRARALGVEDHVVFYDRFVDLQELLDYIAMADVYVAPYLNEAQITSGALAYSFGLGKAIVATPFWHALELLDEGHGVIVPFRDPLALGREVADLLIDDGRRDAMRRRAYAASRSMTWSRTAQRYLAAFDRARDVDRLQRMPAGVRSPPARARRALPEVRLEHLVALCDEQGLFQHALYAEPNPEHGYCTDDNARALLLAMALREGAEPCLPEHLVVRFAAFVQRAWNPKVGGFRNFMAHDGEWLEEIGSEDSQGRTLWALGACALSDADAPRRRWARALFESGLAAAEAFTSPRAWAFALLGLDAYCTAVPDDGAARSMRALLADRLLRALHGAQTEGWIWFEDVLAYDNARLPQALIQTGIAIDSRACIDSGLRSLRWLVELQTAPAGHFRPVGNRSFGRARRLPMAFDQQPLEAAATISACIAAFRVEDRPLWMRAAEGAFTWFHGDNDLRTALVDPETGACADGLHPDRRNENRGAESTLSYLLALVELRSFVRSLSATGAPTRADGQAGRRGAKDEARVLAFPSAADRTAGESA
ncbi:MAG TPA: glycosyltransferase family 4 protein [Pseudomonadales bacterium]|nr:glycosyltransferase family 4 protein [Pseudomonadales bacterium]